MDPTEQFRILIATTFNPARGADPVLIAIIFLATLVAGWLFEGFWPRERFRPTYRGGAVLGLVQAVIYSGVTLYISFNVLRLGHIHCFSRRGRCGGYFYGADGRSHVPSEKLVSLTNQPLHFWHSYLFLFLLAVLFIAWAVVCLRALRTGGAR